MDFERWRRDARIGVQRDRVIEQALEWAEVSNYLVQSAPSVVGERDRLLVEVRILRDMLDGAFDEV